MSTNLLKDIEDFQAEFGIGDYRFGWLAVKNGRFMERVRKGGRVWPDIEKRVRAFMVAEAKRRRAASEQGEEAA